jgi:hypothetical protein
MTTSARIVPELERKLGRPFDEKENVILVFVRLIHPKGKKFARALRKAIYEHNRQISN